MNRYANEFKKTQENSERQRSLNNAVGYVMELHVVIRDTNGSAKKPSHRKKAPLHVQACAMHGHHSADDNTEVASVPREFAVQERIYGRKFFFFCTDFQERKQAEES